jgi:hypothetical protein
MRIRDTVVCQYFRQRFAIELRMAAGSREAAHVGKELDAVRREHCHKRVGR